MNLLRITCIAISAFVLAACAHRLSEKDAPTELLAGLASAAIAHLAAEYPAIQTTYLVDDRLLPYLMASTESGYRFRDAKEVPVLPYQTSSDHIGRFERALISSATITGSRARVVIKFDAGAEGGVVYEFREKSENGRWRVLSAKATLYFHR